MVKLIEVIKNLQSFELREVFINPSHVVSLREDNHMKRNLVEGKMPHDLDTRQDFTKLTLDKGSVGLELTIVGGPSLIESKLKKTEKELLHG
jgi:hypothetical protein